MHPDLFSLGPLHVKTYGFCMALGFLAAWRVLAWTCRRVARDPEPVSNLILLMMVSGVVGSRIAYVIEHWQSEFAGHLERIVRVDQGGLMFYGGLMLAIAVFFVWCFVKRERIVEMADMMTLVIPLGHAFGRVGCFFYGCCYGLPSPAACAVAFPRGSPAWYEQVNRGLIPHSAAAALPVLPTQLFEAGAVLALFGALFLLYRRFGQRLPGVVTGCYFAGYACIRFGIEILRGDPRAEIGPFSISQTISLGLLAAGVACGALASRGVFVRAARPSVGAGRDADHG
ncbi:MAG: prolipoprotein diacylglyceryl transferase [Kiritimatiellia bacterium]